MMVGARITLNIGLDAARDALASLAGNGWLISIPRQQHELRGGHPAGRSLPGYAMPGQGDLVVVLFGDVLSGDVAASAPPSAVLPVRWESLEQGDEFTVLLAADITLAPVFGATPGPAEGAPGMLTLAGVCRLSGTLIAAGHDQARRRVTETARAFITSVADTLTRAAMPDTKPGTAGTALSWVSELPSQ